MRCAPQSSRGYVRSPARPAVLDQLALGSRRLDNSRGGTRPEQPRCPQRPKCPAESRRPARPREGEITVSESAGTGPHRSDPSSPTPGGVLGQGRYRLLAEFGRDDRCGALLWRGRDLMLEREVALTLFIAAPQRPAEVTLIRTAVARA